MSRSGRLKMEEWRKSQEGYTPKANILHIIKIDLIYGGRVILAFRL